MVEARGMKEYALMSFLRIQIGAFLLLALSSLPLQAGSQTNQPPRFQWQRMEQIFSLVVENRDGQELGRVRNLLIDPAAGKVRFVILAPDGVLASRTRLRAVPPHLVSANTAKRDVLGVNITQAQWDEAPTYNSGELLSLGNSGQWEQNLAFYRKAAAADRQAAEKDRDGNTLAPTGNGGPAPERSGSLMLASDLAGRSVFNAKGEKLGEILDLLTSLNEESPVLVLFSSESILNAHEHAFAAPLHEVRLEEKRVTLNANATQLAQAGWLDGRMEFTRPENSVPRVFRYPLAK
jgi:sporulation protein YlmC with PRC-barrel domain